MQLRWPLTKMSACLRLSDEALGIIFTINAYRSPKLRLRRTYG